MRISISGTEYIDANVIAEMWGFSSKSSFYGVVAYRRNTRPEMPFPKPDLVIDQKYFWSEKTIPEIMAWRRWQARGM